MVDPLQARARDAFRANRWTELLEVYAEIEASGIELNDGDRKRIAIAQRQLKPVKWWRRALLGDVVQRPPGS